MSNEIEWDEVPERKREAREREIIRKTIEDLRNDPTEEGRRSSEIVEELKGDYARQLREADKALKERNKENGKFDDRVVLPTEEGRHSNSIVKNLKKSRSEGKNEGFIDKAARKLTNGIEGVAAGIAEVPDKVAEPLTRATEKGAERAVKAAGKVAEAAAGSPNEREKSEPQNEEIEEVLSDIFGEVQSQNINPSKNENKEDVELDEKKKNGNLESPQPNESPDVLKNRESKEIPEANTEGQEFRSERQPEIALKLIFKENPLRKEWFERQLDKFQKAACESPDYFNMIKYGYGYFVPLEIIEHGELSDLLRITGWYDGFYVKNPEIGAIIEQFCGNSQKKTFMKKIGIDNANYTRIINNEIGISLRKLLQLPQEIANQRGLKTKELEDLTKRIDDILINNETTIYKKYKERSFNFYFDDLEVIELKNQKFVILPTSKYETKNKMDAIRQWIEEFKKNNNGKSPPNKEFKKEFGPGFYKHFKKYGFTHNSILELFGLPLNLEFEYDWSDPKNWERAKNWAWLTYIFGKNGKSPIYKEMSKQFSPSMFNYLKKNGPPSLKGRLKVRTYNELLEYWGLPLNLEHKYIWSDPKNWERARNWAWLTYIFSKNRRSPYQKELIKQFPGILTYIKENGVPSGKRGVKIRTHSELLEFWGLPKNDIEAILETANFWDSFGKNCVELYFKNGYTGYQVHHPILKNYIVPDGIIHNFDQRPLNQLGKSIYLEKDQKIDMFVDFKSSFHSMAEKDWRIYTKLAKEFHIFLLNGRSKPYEADGCKIIFHSRNELISILREKITSTNKLKIQFLITNIKLIAQGKIEVVKSLINKTQKRIYDFS